MKKEHLILIAVGIVFLCVLAKKKTSVLPISYIKPGDKGNDVAGLQNALTSFTGLQFENVGAYDNQTLDAVRYYLQDTSALINPESGFVNKEFAKDLYLIQSKVKS